MNFLPKQEAQDNISVDTNFLIVLEKLIMLHIYYEYKWKWIIKELVFQITKLKEIDFEDDVNQTLKMNLMK